MPLGSAGGRARDDVRRGHREGVQHDPAERLPLLRDRSTPWCRTSPPAAGDIEIVGHLAAIGIVKGKPFEPDERMRGILEEAAAVGNATSRALIFDARG